MNGTKIGMVLCLVVLVGAVSGCTTRSSWIPGQRLPLEEVKTSSTYRIIGPAEGESSGKWVLGIIPVGVEAKCGSVGFGINPSLIDPIAAAALYNAIESVPDADALVAPRWHTVNTHHFFWCEKKVTVKGKAIKFEASKF